MEPSHKPRLIVDAFETRVKPIIHPAVKDSDEASSSDVKNNADIIEDFVGYTTLHGFHFLLDAGSTTRRLLWLCLMLLGITMLVVQFVLSWQKLNAYEVMISNGVEENRTLPFPAVTICNQNMLLRSKIEGTQAQRYLDHLDRIKLRFGLAPKDSEDTPFDIEKTVREKGHNISQMAYECALMAETCTAQNFSMLFTSFSRGLCYTFNSGHDGSPIAQVSTSGKMQSLHLGLDAQHYEYYGPFSYDATGFKIAVHDQNDFPIMDEDAYDISPGFFTSIRIKRVKEVTLPAPYPSACGTKKLLNFKNYSFKACLHECYSKNVADTCHCRVLGMPLKGINVTKFCTAKEIKSCIYPALLENNPTKCSCPRPCETIRYKVQLSSAYYPSQHIWETLLPKISLLLGLNTTGLSDDEIMKTAQDYVRKRYAQVAIFYESLLTDVVREKAAYDISAFGCEYVHLDMEQSGTTDIGGNMGLFLGCSLLTIFEFVDLLITMCIINWRRRTAKISAALKERKDQCDWRKD